MNRIKFYSKEDLNVQYDQTRLRDLINQDNFNEGLIDVLEYHNIKKYIENDCVFYEGFEDIKESYTRVIKNKISEFFGYRSLNEVKKDFHCLFKVISDDSKSKISGTDNRMETYFYYREDYIECFENYNLKNKVNSSELNSVIKTNEIPIGYFLKSKYFVKNYKEILKEYFLSDLTHFELLINNYSLNSVGYLIPKNISKDEMYKFADDYINFKNANYNTLKMINNKIKGLKEFDIDEDLRLSAEIRLKKISESMDNNKTEIGSVRTEYRIYSELNLYESDHETEYKTLIDVDWIENNNNPASLLNLLVSTNLLFNDSWILNLCYFPNKDGSLFKYISNNSKNHYETNLDFKIKNALMLETFKYFQLALKEKVGSSIEDLIFFFFFEYLKNEFSINWLPMVFPHEENNIKIKIQNLFVLDEAIKKQWYLYAKKTDLDPKLYRYVDTPTNDKLESILKYKYIYLNKENKDIMYFTFLLFSTQSGLSHINNELFEENLLLLLTVNDINFSQLHKYQVSKINNLIEAGIISLSEDDVLIFNDNQIIRIRILQSVYYNGVINFYYLFTGLSSTEKKVYQQEIIKMINEKLLINTNSLLSIPEQEYLNFLLNDRDYDNSLRLRNKYQHAGELDDIPNDYYYGLIVIIIYINKINEELILSTKMNN